MRIMVEEILLGDVTKLMRRGPEIFQAIKSLLFDAAINDESIKAEYLVHFGLRCDFLGKLFLLCDGFFSILNKKIEYATYDDKEKLGMLSKKMVAAWRCLKEAVPPNVHTTEDHIDTQFDDLEGMGCYLEEFVEVAHQTKKKDLHRSRHHRDYGRRFFSYTRLEEARNNPKIKEKIDCVMQKKRQIVRTNKKEEQEAKRAKTLQDKWIERDEILLEWQPTQMPTPTAIRKEIQALESNNSNNS